MSGEVDDAVKVRGAMRMLASHDPLAIEEEVVVPPQCAGEAVDEQTAEMLQAACRLLRDAPPSLVNAITLTVSTPLRDEPLRALAVWRHCRGLAKPLGLRASAVLRGEALTIRLERLPRRSCLYVDSQCGTTE